MANDPEFRGSWGGDLSQLANGMEKFRASRGANLPKVANGTDESCVSGDIVELDRWQIQQYWVMGAGGGLLEDQRQVTYENAVRLINEMVPDHTQTATYLLSSSNVKDEKDQKEAREIGES